MRIIYCKSCGEKVDPEEIESGKAVIHDLSTYCMKCSLEQSWNTPGQLDPARTRPVSAADAPRASLHSARRRFTSVPGVEVPVSRPRHGGGRASAHNLPPVSAGAAKGSARGQHSSNTIIYTSVGIGIFFCSMILAVALLMRSEESDSHEIGSTQKTDTPDTPDSSRSPAPAPDPPDRPDAEETDAAIVARTEAEARRFGDTADGHLQRADLWRRVVSRLSTEARQIDARQRLEQANQQAFDETDRQAKQRQSAGDKDGALRLWRNFRARTTENLWKQRAQTKIDDFTKEPAIPVPTGEPMRPTDRWMKVVSESGANLCPSHAAQTKAWRYENGLLIGRMGEIESNFTHANCGMVGRFSMVFELRIRQGGVGIAKFHPGGDPAFTMLGQVGDGPGAPGDGQWHRIQIQSVGDKIRLWFDNRLLQDGLATNVSGELGFAVFPNTDLDIRNALLLKID